MNKNIAFLAAIVLMLGLNSCTPIEKPVACIEFSDSDLVGFPNFPIKMSSACSQNIGELEWIIKNDTFYGGSINVQSYIKNNSTLSDTINLNVYGIRPDDKSSTYFILNAEKKKKRIPGFILEPTYYDGSTSTSCPFYKQVRIIKASPGDPYEYYIQNVQNPAIKAGIVITGATTNYNYSNGTDFEMYFNIPQQTITGFYIIGSGYINFVLNSQSQLVGTRYLNITIDSQSECGEYIGSDL